MRLFLAVDPDAAARAALAEVIGVAARRLAASAPSLRWVDALAAHLTLHFLGEVAPDRARRLTDALQQPAGRAPFVLSLDRFGAFPPAGPPRTIWLGVGDGAGALGDVHADLGRRLAALGIPLESRPYAPHLTLARVRDARSPNLRGLRESLAGIPVTPITWQVDRAVLYRSDLAGPRPQYTALAVMPFELTSR